MDGALADRENPGLVASRTKHCGGAVVGKRLS